MVTLCALPDVVLNLGEPSVDVYIFNLNFLKVYTSCLARHDLNLISAALFHSPAVVRCIEAANASIQCRDRRSSFDHLVELYSLLFMAYDLDLNPASSCAFLRIRRVDLADTRHFPNLQCRAGFESCYLWRDGVSGPEAYLDTTTINTVMCMRLNTIRAADYLVCTTDIDVAHTMTFETLERCMKDVAITMTERQAAGLTPTYHTEMSKNAVCMCRSLFECVPIGNCGG